MIWQFGFAARTGAPIRFSDFAKDGVSPASFAPARQERLAAARAHDRRPVSAVQRSRSTNSWGHGSPSRKTKCTAARRQSEPGLAAELHRRIEHVQREPTSSRHPDIRQGHRAIPAISCPGLSSPQQSARRRLPLYRAKSSIGTWSWRFPPARINAGAPSGSAPRLGWTSWMAPNWSQDRIRRSEPTRASMWRVRMSPQPAQRAPDTRLFGRGRGIWAQTSASNRFTGKLNPRRL